MTSDNTDIREWARSSGREIGERGRISQEIKDEYYAATGTEPPLTIVRDPAEGAEGEPVAPQTAGETAPRTKVRKPRSTNRRRSSLDKLGAGMWGAVSYMFGGTAHPVGRVLGMQAPVAGAVIDDAIAGTLVDKVLQPFARASAKGEMVFALAGPPVLVGVVVKYPHLMGAVRPVLTEALVSWWSIAAPKMEQMAAAQAKLSKRLGIDVTEIDAMIDMIFAQPEAERVPT